MRVYEEEDAFRALLRGERTRVYHCTRLLGHESGWIRTEGLRPLSAVLVESRIRAARAEGHLTRSTTSFSRRTYLGRGARGIAGTRSASCRP